MNIIAEPIKSRGPRPSTHAGTAWVTSINTTTGLKIVLYFIKSKNIENNKFKNKIKVGLMTGKSHNAKPQYENNWYQAAIYFIRV
jgi:hypothetical protein